SLSSTTFFPYTTLFRSLCWLVTGDEKYFAKAREILLAASTWHLGPPGKPVDWKKGPVPGATDIYYNDEAHFRLWRKLPLVYDQRSEEHTSELQSRGHLV